MTDLQLPPFRLKHIAYVTSDIESGKRRLSAMYGVTEFEDYPELSVKIPGGGKANFTFALATANGVDLEVIKPLGEQDSVYRRALPSDPTDIAFHHFASIVQNEAEWQMVLDAAKHHDIEVLVQGGEEYGVHYIYLDTRRYLGHILEYIWM